MRGRLAIALPSTVNADAPFAVVYLGTLVAQVGVLTAFASAFGAQSLLNALLGQLALALAGRVLGLTHWRISDSNT